MLRTACVVELHAASITLSNSYSYIMPTILVTNDDGIDSPGLKAAVEAVFPLGTIIVLAPSIQQTATGRGLFGDKLKIRPRKANWVRDKPLLKLMGKI